MVVTLDNIAAANVCMMQVVKLSTKISSSVQERLSGQQKDFYLRQQLKSIKQELGEEVNHSFLLKEITVVIVIVAVVRVLRQRAVATVEDVTALRVLLAGLDYSSKTFS
jgi:ATP-dependent Lon protease